MKDRKILFELDKDSRQSFSQLGKRVGLSKNVVKYRLERLEKNGIINNYYTAIDVYRLGIIVVKFHYVFQYTTPKIEDEIISYFTDNNHTVVVASAKGTYDLSVIIIVSNIREFYQFCLKTQELFGRYFQSKSLAFFINERHHMPSYLLPESCLKDRKKAPMITGGGGPVDIDEIEHELLRLIGSDARIKLSDLGEQLGVSVQVVRYRLKKLLVSGIIRGFRVGIDVNNLGLQIYKVLLYLNDFEQRSSIISKIEQHPAIVFVDTYTGDADLDLEFHLENVNQLYQIMHELSETFPESIRHYKYYCIIKYHKFLYMPEQ
jgi:Lrp/AsnC family leucine-responsive transcriptional regulator